MLKKSLMSTKTLVEMLPGPVEIRVPGMPTVDITAVANRITGTRVVADDGQVADILMIPVRMIAPIVEKTIRSRFGFGIADIFRAIKLARVIYKAIKELRK